MAEKTINCPSCGAPLELESRFTTLVVCQFCGQTSHIRDDGIDPTGKVAKLTEYISRLQVGKAATVGGRKCQVIGRVRYRYEDGVWDEWFVNFDDGQPGWISEDEGDYVLYFKKRLTSPIPPWNEIRVGGFVSVPPMNVFVTEKGSGSIVGAEGEISFSALPGETFHYVDGNAAGKAVGVVFTQNGINFYSGEPLEFHDIVVS